MNELPQPFMDAIVREKHDALYERAKNERAVRTPGRSRRSLRLIVAATLEAMGGACYKLSNVISR